MSYLVCPASCAARYRRVNNERLVSFLALFRGEVVSNSLRFICDIMFSQTPEMCLRVNHLFYYSFDFGAPTAFDIPMTRACHHIFGCLKLRMQKWDQKDVIHLSSKYEFIDLLKQQTFIIASRKYEYGINWSSTSLHPRWNARWFRCGGPDSQIKSLDDKGDTNNSASSRSVWSLMR